jgi:hypothetical protein
MVTDSPSVPIDRLFDKIPVNAKLDMRNAMINDVIRKERLLQLNKYAFYD